MVNSRQHSLHHSLHRKAARHASDTLGAMSRSSLRHFLFGNTAEYLLDAPPLPDTNMNVGDVCDRDVTTVTARTTLADAARLLCDGSVEAIVAIASNASQPTAIGVVTALDILRAMLDRGGDLCGLNVVDILSRHPLVLNRDERIQDAITKLHASGVLYAPVVGPGGTLCGAISQSDLLMHCLTTHLPPR